MIWFSNLTFVIKPVMKSIMGLSTLGTIVMMMSAQCQETVSFIAVHTKDDNYKVLMNSTSMKIGKSHHNVNYTEKQYH